MKKLLFFRQIKKGIDLIQPDVNMLAPAASHDCHVFRWGPRTTTPSKTLFQPMKRSPHFFLLQRALTTIPQYHLLSLSFSSIDGMILLSPCPSTSLMN